MSRDCFSHEGRLYSLASRYLVSTPPSAPARPIVSPLVASCRPGSTEVKASLVFGPPDPSALEILWTLYRKVKPSRWLLGHLSLANHGLSSDGESRETPVPCFLTCPWRMLASLYGGSTSIFPNPE